MTSSEVSSGKKNESTGGMAMLSMWNVPCIRPRWRESRDWQLARPVLIWQAPGDMTILPSGDSRTDQAPNTPITTTPPPRYLHEPKRTLQQEVVPAEETDLAPTSRSPSATVPSPQRKLEKLCPSPDQEQTLSVSVFRRSPPTNFISRPSQSQDSAPFDAALLSCTPRRYLPLRRERKETLS